MYVELIINNNLNIRDMYALLKNVIVQLCTQILCLIPMQHGKVL